MYTIDKNLPWFTDVETLENGVYVNILSSNYSDDDNPNGLYSGFLTDNIFYTSVWTGTHFTPSCIPKNEIDSYMYIEYFQETQNPPEDTLKSFTEKLKEEMERLRKESQENSRDSSPWKTNPYEKSPNSPYDSRSIEDALEKLRKSPIITLGSHLNNKETQDFLKGFQQLFQTKG